MTPDVVAAALQVSRLQNDVENLESFAHLPLAEARRRETLRALTAARTTLAQLKAATR